MDILIFGPPGAGKGTQASAVCELKSVAHVATGDIFRKHLKQGTELGRLAQSYMDKGALVPDEVVVDIVVSRLAEPDATDGVLFDGFPRTVKQAELLHAWLVRNARAIDVVINLVVPDEVIIERLSGRRTCLGCGATYHVDNNPTTNEGVCDRCGGADVVQRSDDQPEKIRKRLVTYHRETAPVLDWLRSRSAVCDIDSNQAIASVRAAVIEALQD